MKCGYCGTRELTTGDFDGKCCICRNVINNHKAEVESIKGKFYHFAKNQRNIPIEFIDIINKEFWDLI